MEKKSFIYELKRTSLHGIWMKFLVVFFVFGTVSLYADELSGSSIMQNPTVTGKVTDAVNGEELIGVTVLLKGTQNGVITSVDGTYSINVPDKDAATLTFSYLGYSTKEVEVKNQSVLDVALEPSSQQLDELVVTALGIKREARALGYAVSKIDAGDLVKTGTTNFASALYGKATGVRIQSAPGSTSAVSINIRGLNSITGTNQPLIVLDGVPIRSGDANKDGYWTDQRIRGNGLIDINPEDIGEISILKGASASALYGSEAANGVVLITTKSAASGKKGVGIDFNASYSFDKATYLPKYQTIYGPGINWEDRSGEWATGDGWREVNYQGKTYYRLQYEDNTRSFGPKFDGREVIYWDGTVRKYLPYNDGNGWERLFKPGHTGSYNLAISSVSDKSNLRFSYTFNNVENVQRGNSGNNRHNFNMTGTFSPIDRLKIDYTANYMRNNILNRAYRISRITNNFGGMFSTFDDVDLMYNKTVTSRGYMFTSSGNTETPTPNEAFAYNIGAGQLLSEYFWNIRKKREEETVNKFLSSVTPTLKIVDGLSLRGRLATELNAETIESKNSTEKPLVYGATGSYKLTNNRFESYYGDIMLMFDRSLTERFRLSVNAGYTGRSEKYYSAWGETNGGLSVENWYHLNASVNKANADMKITRLLKQAFFGMINLSYNSYLYTEITGRSETSSTLPSGSNRYFYPSANAGFVFTDAFRNSIPNWFNYGKLRASWGIVGNAPEIYDANNAYNQSSTSGYIYIQIPENLGNEKIRPEEKHETELGLELKMFRNRLGLDVSLYSSKLKDQILKSTTSWSSGANLILLNVGELSNKGLEIALYGTPIETKDFRWDLRGNVSFAKNKVTKLMDGLNELEHTSIDGAVRIVSKVGEPMGDIYTQPIIRDNKGNPVVENSGLYSIDRTRWEKVGNAMPDYLGGFATTFTYKNLFVDMSLDFTIGGDILNTPYQYLMGRGAIIESLNWRDAEHGGLSYYVNSNNVKVLTTGSQGPNGEKVRDDGLILPGVKADGTPNDIVVSSGTYYPNVYNWGASGNIDYSKSVFDNSYIKVRELSFGYNIPKSIAAKLGCRNLTLSVFGRNLFYIYRNLPLFDSEATDGTDWVSRTSIGGSTATTRSFGATLRMSF